MTRSFLPRLLGSGLLSLLLAACGGGGSATVDGAATASGASGTTATARAALDVGATPADAAPAAAAPPPPAPPPPVANPPANPPPAVTLDDSLLNARERLGKLIFSDTNLSEPRGTACVSCHQPNMGFAGNNGSRVGVAQGSRPGVLGFRNAMTNAYTGFVPGFSFREDDGEVEAIGGHFWDGRAATLALQALGPFLNTAEMNNPSAKAVVDKIAAAGYANLFRQEFGAGIFSNPDNAYTQVGVAIEAFERSVQLQSFTSKYDAMVRGQARFTPAESRGMALFMDTSRANCAGCHLMNPATGKPQDSLFSEYTYYATGVPRNRAIPANADSNFFDLGLCGPSRAKADVAATLAATITRTVSVEAFCGKFRMPTLRNVAERPAYMHNGFFKDLRDVVRFYSTRSSNPERVYGPAGIPDDLPMVYQGNLETTKAPFNRSRIDGPLLNEAEITDLVSFLRTLSDGFRSPATP